MHTLSTGPTASTTSPGLPTFAILTLPWKGEGRVNAHMRMVMLMIIAACLIMVVGGGHTNLACITAKRHIPRRGLKIATVHLPGLRASMVTPILLAASYPSPVSYTYS